MEILTMENVGLNYQTTESETKAIKNVTFSVRDGEFVALVGPSGCGKTTILSLISGLIKPSCGSIRFGSKEDAKVGYMLQKDTLFEWLTIEKNVLLGAKINKKISALVLAGVLACSMPMPVMASSDTEVVESLLDSGIDFLASDPEKAVDIIMYAKDLVDQQNITDDQVRSAVTQAADHFGVSLSDSDVDSLVSVVRKVLDAKIDEDALRSDVNSVYNKLQDMGVTKDDAKGLVAKLLDFVKGLFE